MSVDAVYRGRRARVVGDYAPKGEGWVGPLLDYGDGLVFGVLFSDPNLEIEPSDLDGEDDMESFDSVWADAAPALDRLPGPFDTLPDGSTAVIRNTVKHWAVLCGTNDRNGALPEVYGPFISIDDANEFLVPHRSTCDATDQAWRDDHDEADEAHDIAGMSLGHQDKTARVLGQLEVN
jgi:hypothetical protein